MNKTKRQRDHRTKKNNTQIKIICDGVDEENALVEIVELFENLP